MDPTAVTSMTSTKEEQESRNRKRNYWTTRDVAQELFLQRDAIASSNATPAAKSTVVSSCHFDVDTCLSRIRRDKAAVVRVAFGTAAATVLNAVIHPPTKTPSPAPSSSVPSLVGDYKKLQDLRITSLNRAHDNKEVVSRNKKAADGTPAEAKKKQTTTIAPAQSKKEKTASSSASNKGTTSPVSATTASAALLDSRSTVSRAILCAAGTIAFDKLTPSFPGQTLDALDVPQNTPTNTGTEQTLTTDKENTADSTSNPSVNMGAVLLQARPLGLRTASMVKNASRRSKQRYEYRRDYYSLQKKDTPCFFPDNPFAIKPQGDAASDKEIVSSDLLPATHCRQQESGQSLTKQWTNACLPRLVSVLNNGSGHAVYCDLDWNHRHGRAANMLRHLAAEENNYGPHLIVTTHPQVDEFACEFESMVDADQSWMDSSTEEEKQQTTLRVLTYRGDNSERSMLRQKYLSHMDGLADSKAHVVATSYSTFLKDYLFLCQIPYQVVLLDQGMSWLSSAHADPNGSLAALWESGVWSSSDSHVGLAGTSHSFFHQDDLFQSAWSFYNKGKQDKNGSQCCIGLTARYRIMTTPQMVVEHRDAKHLTPVSGLLSFLIPHFCDVVREEWDRSRITNDPESMEHFRKLMARAIVVHCPTSNDNLYQLALDAMKGTLSQPTPTADALIEHDNSQDGEGEELPSLIPDETFVSHGKVSQSRRFALSWLGPPLHSWLRYELGNASFEPVLSAMKQSSAHGQVCEEIVTASSTTSSGAGGTVSGTQAYRLAVRCGRNFGSEQGLRQHMAALHAPPGTWLCRTCGGDCGTSQARTHHERSCGQPSGGNQGNPAGGGASTVGQGVRQQQYGPSGVVGKKSKSGGGGGGGASRGGAFGSESSKDKDGSFRVPGYRGVWVNPAGRHFVKIEGTPLKDNDGEEEQSADGNMLLFDSIEEAARKHDEVATEKGSAAELNFNPDGTRIVYEESAAAGRGLDMVGGGASSVVPALSVINIKDLPPGVKPLLRDPRQTSRTGGNSKRHVYAYRGVCRQARKGHDRWQSQISFGGTNHYLGTFDSEWDAAAIYAWAHLILYGEEATKKAQKEGEEAAAAYEQEKKDIAAGKIVAPPPKPAKKKPAKKKDQQKKGTKGTGNEPAKSTTPSKKDDDGNKVSKKRPAKESNSSEKKPKVASKAAGAKGDNASIAPILAKGVGKAPVLAPRQAFKGMSEKDLVNSVSEILQAVRGRGYCLSDTAAGISAPIQQELRSCAPISSTAETHETPSGSAMLLGLSGSLFAWTVDSFVQSSRMEEGKADVVSLVLNQEYGRGGFNERFRTVLQGSMCLIGRASTERERASESLGLGTVQLGGTSGEMDCNIGGVAGSCSEIAAVIQKSSSGGSSDFQFFATNNTDMVSLNGRQVKAEMGSFPLFNEDVCTVGARVFVFLLPMDA